MWFSKECTQLELHITLLLLGYPHIPKVGLPKWNVCQVMHSLFLNVISTAMCTMLAMQGCSQQLTAHSAMLLCSLSERGSEHTPHTSLCYSVVCITLVQLGPGHTTSEMTAMAQWCFIGHTTCTLSPHLHTHTPMHAYTLAHIHTHIY